MNGYARYETKPLDQPDEPGLKAGDVAANQGNTALGHHIRQQYRYYRQFIRRQAREHGAAQVIRALAQLVFAVGIVAALLISLTVLLPQSHPGLTNPAPQLGSPSSPTVTDPPPTDPPRPLHPTLVPHPTAPAGDPPPAPLHFQPSLQSSLPLLFRPGLPVVV